MFGADLPLHWPAIGAALLAGLFGGVHCAAMCGGIAASLSLGQRPAASLAQWWQALQPNLGRIFGYGIAGALAGGVGRGLIELIHSAGLITLLRSALGLVLILVALRMLGRVRGFDLFAGPAQRLWQALRPLQRRLLPADTAYKRIGIGLLWGWLPCGLSLSLLAVAWLQAGAVAGALTMLAFGLGTLATLLPLTWTGARLGQRLQRGGARTLAGVLVLCVGLITLAAPWLIQVPALHGALRALGCVPVG